MVSINVMTGTVAKMIQLMTSSLFESIVRFLGICMLVKALSLEEFGEYSIIVSIAAITATLVNFGGYNLVMSSQKETKEIYFSEVFVTLLNTFVLISLLTFFSLFYDVSLLIVSVFLSEHFLVSIQGITYSSLLKERKELVLSLVRTSVAILFLLVCAIFSYVESSENVFISLYVAYSFISCAIYIISVIYIDSKKINIVFICINEYQFRLKDGIWFLSSGLARSAFFNIDKVIVGFFFNKEITAIYAITMRIYNALFSVVNSALAATESAFYHLRNSELKNHYLNSLKYSFGISLIISLVAIITIPILVRLFPSDYHIIVDFLYLISITLVLQSVLWNNLNYFNGIRKERIRLFCMILGMTSLFILNGVNLSFSLEIYPLYIYTMSIVFILLYSFGKVSNES